MHFPSDLIPLPTAPYDQRPDSMPLVIEECRTAIWKAKGNITEAAAILKVTSLRLRKYVAQSPYLTAELEESKDQLLDRAEAQIADALEDTEDKIRADNAAKFVLTNLGARRGYGTKGSGITLNTNGKSGSFTVSWGDGTDINDNIEESEGQVIDHE